ncbi:MAG: hypothetical protein QOI61_1659, partial [Actinomycetota bacterium]
SRDVQRDLEVVNQLRDPFIRRSLKTALHVRRYFVLYLFLVVALIAVALVPSIQDRGTDKDVQASGARTDLDNSFGSTDTTAAGDSGATVTDSAAAPTQRVTRSVADSLKAAQTTGGKTRGGVECKPGVRQLTASRYASPCTAAFTGDNGGATAFGVNSKEVIVVRRGFADSANSNAVNAVVKQAGGADPEYTRAVRDVFVKYFEQQFELYGRHIKFVDYESQHGNSTDEALGQGREGACLDATYIHDTLHAFAVIGGKNAGAVSAVFAECATERGMVTFGAASYYPEKWYKSQKNYSWGGVMECERISYQLSEYIGKRLVNKKAKWAGDPVTRNTKRKFAVYIPDDPNYQYCNEISKEILEKKYGVKKSETSQYNYRLDVSRFADQASQAIVQFHADQSTTIILACDPISTIFLTQNASKQGFFPEWVQIGTALSDVDNAARLWDQTEVDGHLFGPSQLGSTPKLFGPQSEPAILYKALTGKSLTEGGATDGAYWSYIGLYSVFQSAGPNLSKDAIAAGTFSLPPAGAPDYSVGYFSYRDGPDATPGALDHTGIDDAREIYWMGTKQSDFDGETGTYVETYGGKRFRNGEWPAEDPPIYPGR